MDTNEAPATLICESYDCRSWEGETLVMPKLVPKWNGNRWRYCCSKCGSDYGFQPHPDLPDLSTARLAR